MEQFAWVTDYEGSSSMFHAICDVNFLVYLKIQLKETVIYFLFSLIYRFSLLLDWKKIEQGLVYLWHPMKVSMAKWLQNRIVICLVPRTLRFWLVSKHLTQVSIILIHKNDSQTQNNVPGCIVQCSSPLARLLLFKHAI